MRDDNGYLILHGWQNRRPPGHWQRFLARALEADGARVVYPQLPDPDTPHVDDWIEVARLGIEELGPGATVICHSLSCLMWAQLAPRLEARERADRVLWVAPPGPSLFESEPAIASFAPIGLDAEAIRTSSASHPVRLACSDADPYCPEGAVPTYVEPLGLDADVLIGQAHINLDAGYGEWPSVLEWCRDPAVRLRART